MQILFELIVKKLSNFEINLFFNCVILWLLIVDFEMIDYEKVMQLENA